LARKSRQREATIGKTLVKVLTHGWEVYGKESYSSMFKTRKEPGVIPSPFFGVRGVLTLSILKDAKVKTLEEACVALHHRLLSKGRTRSTLRSSNLSRPPFFPIKEEACYYCDKLED
jgi:hypothetical protein